MSLPVPNVKIIPEEYRLCFVPVSSVTCPVNNAAFPAFFVVVKVQWDRNCGTVKEKLNKSRGVY